MKRAAAIQAAVGWYRTHYHVAVPVIPALVEQSSDDMWRITLKTTTKAPLVTVAVSAAGVAPAGDDVPDEEDACALICTQPATLDLAGQQLCARYAEQHDAACAAPEAAPPQDELQARSVGDEE